jgi:hypothetical protein
MLLFFAAISSPWWAPNVALEGDRQRQGVGFARYPYADERPGWLDIAYVPDALAEDTTPADVDQRDTTTPVRASRKWALQLGGEAGYVFDRVWRQGLNLRLQTAQRIEFDAYYSFFEEREPHSFDNLVIGREHLVVRFAESDTVQFHSSLGPQHLFDALGNVNGIDFAYGVEIFPGRPVILSLEGALGNLGSAFAPRVRATLGLSLKRVELLLGYDHQWIGRETLGGPIAGVRLWL